MDINKAKENLKGYLNWLKTNGFSMAENDEAIQIILSELEKKDKRLKRQFKIITKKDKQIEEIKQIAHNDFEERCKLTFKIEKLENKLDKQEKIINLMAEHIEKGCDFDNRIQTKQQILEYFTNKVEEDIKE